MLSPMQTTRNPSLEHNTELYEPRLLFGVPSKLFVVALLFVIFILIFFGWVSSFVVFFIFIPPLIMVHAKDSKGLSFLLDKVLRPQFYSAGEVGSGGFVVVRKQGDIYTSGSLNTDHYFNG